MEFVFFLNPAQDRNRVGNRRLRYKYRLETPRKGRVFFDILAVFIKRGRTNAMKFTAREIRRGNRYDAIILDPPKFGRGPKNETWRFEENLPELLDTVRDLLSERPRFVILTAYAVRLSYIALAQALADRLRPFGGTMEMGEMALPQKDSGRLLPTAIYARWRAAD